MGYGFRIYLIDEADKIMRIPATRFDRIRNRVSKESLPQFKNTRIRYAMVILELENREKVIVLKNITREEAKKEIQKLFSSGRTLYYSDIVQELGIDLETVVEICNELEEEKEIGVDASVS